MAGDNGPPGVDIDGGGYTGPSTGTAGPSTGNPSGPSLGPGWNTNNTTMDTALNSSWMTTAVRSMVGILTSDPFGIGPNGNTGGIPGDNSDGGTGNGAGGGYADQDSIRAELAATAARQSNEAARKAAEQARREEEAAAAQRAEAVRKKEERERAARARQVAADERARNRMISAMQNGQTSSILTSPGGVINPVFTTSSPLWGLQVKPKKKLLGQ